MAKVIFYHESLFPTEIAHFGPISVQNFDTVRFYILLFEFFTSEVHTYNLGAKNVSWKKSKISMDFFSTKSLFFHETFNVLGK